jgi:N,N'-diacetyllegionaminate synthase
MSRTYIIAEIGSNHNGSFKTALKYIKTLSKLDIDAVKFQHGDPNSIYSLDAIVPKYQSNYKLEYKDIINKTKSRLLTIDEHRKLSIQCKKLKLDYLCSAFDLNSLKEIDKYTDLKAYKIASGELLTLDMLEYISLQNKEIYLSIGMSDDDDIRYSLKILNKNNKKNITLLHCVSAYPTNISDLNLKYLDTLIKKFKLPIGLSDHSDSHLPSIISISKGARVVEKHVTFSKKLKGPDHKMSLDINQFSDLVTSIRDTETIIGKNIKIMNKDELNVKNTSRKSIVLNKDIAKGKKIRKKDIEYKRPGFGISPIYYSKIIKSTTRKKISKNRIFGMKDLIID